MKKRLQLPERRLKIGLKCIQDLRQGLRKIKKENKIMKPKEREETGAEVEVEMPENLWVQMTEIETDNPQDVHQGNPRGVHQRVLQGGHLVIRHS